mgnify:CR=1 FL=1
MNGIFRDVYLLHRPEQCIEDYFITTDIHGSTAGVAVRLRYYDSAVATPTRITLYDAAGTMVGSVTPVEAPDDAAFPYHAEITIIDPTLWNAEQPYLYKAEIEKDEKYGLVEAAKLLVSNKYYLMICVTYILLADLWCHDQHGYLLHRPYPWRQEPVRRVLLGHQHSFDHRTGLYPDPRCQDARYVQTERRQLCPCYRSPCAGCCGWLYGFRRCQDDAPLHGYCCTGSEPVAGPVVGRHERCYCLLLRVHLADEAQARGRHDVFLHLARCQAGRRPRHCHHRLAAGVQSL